MELKKGHSAQPSKQKTRPNVTCWILYGPTCLFNFCNKIYLGLPSLTWGKKPGINCSTVMPGITKPNHIFMCVGSSTSKKGES